MAKVTPGPTEDASASPASLDPSAALAALPRETQQAVGLVGAVVDVMSLPLPRLRARQCRKLRQSQRAQHVLRFLAWHLHPL